MTNHVDSEAALGLKRTLTASSSSQPKRRAPMVSTLSYAQPVPDNHASYGSPDMIPTLPGVFVAYVSVLAKHECYTVVDLIRRQFTYLLGSDHSSRMHAMEDITTSLSQSHQFEAMKVLSHIAKCIDTGIRTQTRVFPIYDNGEYQGSCLLGARFSISHRLRVFGPVCHADLMRAISGVSVHASALRVVCGIVSVEAHTITSMRALRDEYMASKDNISVTQLEEFKKCLPKLSFNQPFYAINESRVCEAMNLLLNPDIPLSNDVPLHHSVFFATDRESLVLGAFGYTAFSFEISNARRIQLSADAFPGRLVARQKTLKTCIEDMAMIRAVKYLHNNPTSLSSQYMDRPMGKSTATIWASLKTLSNSATVVTQQRAMPVIQSSVFDY